MPYLPPPGLAQTPHTPSHTPTATSIGLAPYHRLWGRYNTLPMHYLPPHWEGSSPPCLPSCLPLLLSYCHTHLLPMWGAAVASPPLTRLPALPPRSPLLPHLCHLPLPGLVSHLFFPWEEPSALTPSPLLLCTCHITAIPSFSLPCLFYYLALLALSLHTHALYIVYHMVFIFLLWPSWPFTACYTATTFPTSAWPSSALPSTTSTTSWEPPLYLQHTLQHT